MILPSIDLRQGESVQLVGGKEHALTAGDPVPLALKFRIAGEVAVIDLDAALGTGNNTETIKKLLAIAPCRVGGGIRDAETALAWLDAGANQVILGTKAIPEVLEKLPRHRVIAALDAIDGEVVVDGWQTRTGETIGARLERIRPYVGGVMVTFVEREGRLQGIDLTQVQRLKQLCGDLSLTIAGGISSLEELAQLDTLGVNAQLGMALYTNRITLGDAIIAPLLNKSTTEKLWPTVVTDESGYALGLCWSSRESINQAVSSCRGVYQSRKRGIWVKGQTSGATQDLLRIDLDCDRDCLRFTVRQQPPGFCHLETLDCWGTSYRGLRHLENILQTRLLDAPPGSYTKRLFNEPQLLASKLREETEELILAEGKDHIASEAADLLYFTLAYLAKHKVTLSEVERLLEFRTKRVTRRPGNAKT